MADGVDAMVDPMQSTKSEPMLDAAAPDPQPPQLPVGDDTVLPLRQLPDHPVAVTRVKKPMHFMGKSTRVGFRPP